MGSRSQEELVEVDGSADPPGLRIGPASAWINENVAGVSLPLRFGLIAAGSSNLTYRVEDAAGRVMILRRPPAAAVLASAHDVGREHKIMESLRSTKVPVPQPLALCKDAEVIGAPFYVMSYEEGLILRTRQLALDLGGAGCGRAAKSFFETLAAIHELDPGSCGLGDLSRTHGYVERQLKRWLQQYRNSLTGPPNPLVVALHDRLAAQVPDEADDGGHLVHGDYHIDNVVMDGQLHVKAVLDWELATLGDPIADLAWALMFWARPGDELVMMQEAVTAAPGFPERDEAASIYARAAGRTLDTLPYFSVFTLWKLACLIQGSLYRAQQGGSGGQQQGKAADPADTEKRIQRMLEQASDLADEAGI